MTRPVYTDLILPFTPGTSTQPSASNLASIITRLFKLGYGIIEEMYVAETTHTIMDTENVYSAIVADAEVIGTEWNNSYSEEDSKTPIIKLSDETIKIIKRQTVRGRHITGRVRLWNSDRDWS